MSDVWDFKKNADGRWVWCRQTLRHEVIRQGSRAFTELEECVADARRYGYAGSFSIAAEPRRNAPRRALRPHSRGAA